MPHQQVDELKARLVGYARLVEGMIEKSVKALRQRRPEALREVIGEDERRVNEQELELESACAAFIAQHQPKARQLRTALMVLGMTNDLERMGDHAVNIAEAALDLLGRFSRDVGGSLPRLAEEAVRMVGGSIRAFIGEDTALARQVCEGDSVVDGLATGILEDLVAAMAADRALIEPGLLVLKIAANLERIADLSTNMGEDVIYMAEGRVIKHHHEEGGS